MIAETDVEYLRDSLAAPVEYCPLQRGYRYSDSAFQLPAVTITDPQKQALALLAKQYKEMEGDDRLGLGELFGKLEKLADERHGQSRGLPLQRMEKREADSRVAAALNAVMKSPLEPKPEPFYADIYFEMPETVEALQLEAIHHGNAVYRVRYYSVELFTRLLLTIPYEVRIVSPNWLRNMLRHRLEKKLRGLSR